MALRQFIQVGAAVLAALLVPLAAPGLAQESTYVVAVPEAQATSAGEVRLFVTVTDSQGLSVPGLRARDFGIEEDGVSIDDFEFVQHVEGSSRLLDVVLAIDVSGSMQEPTVAPAIDAARAGLLGFLDTAKGLGEEKVRVTVLFFGDDVRKVDGDWAELARAVRTEPADDSETHLYDAIDRAVSIASEGAAGTSRRAVVVLTDGEDQGRNDGEPGSALSLEDLLSELKAQAPEESVEVFPVGVGDPDGDALQAIADASGGSFRRVQSTEDLPQAYDELASGLPAVTYGLTYPSPSASQEERTVRVAVSIDGFEWFGEAEYYPSEAERPTERKIDWTLIALAVLGVMVVVLLIVVLTSRGGGRPSKTGAPVGEQAPWLGPAFVAAGYRFPINAPEMSIGRDPSTDICIAEPSVSRVHARVMMSPEGLLLEDLNSSNGTFVNDEPIRATYLRDGDSVIFGTVQLQFEVRAT